MLPHDFPKWQVAYCYFSKWKEDATFEEIHENLRDECRKGQEKAQSPGVGLIDSQRVKTSRIGGDSRGVDGGKMKKIYADGGCRGEVEEKVRNDFKQDMEITLRWDKSTGFPPYPNAG